MEAFLNSTLIVALTEMGDKTQLLALVLMVKFKKPIPILWGIFVATVLNHALASSVGVWVSEQVPELYMKWGLAILFWGFGAWVLIPDKEDKEELKDHHGIFLTTLIVFFLAEMGDKTQLATVAMAAKYQNLLGVTLGSTFGMMISNGMAVIWGPRLIKKIPMHWMHRIASALFILMGFLILLN
ncbi:MAG: TMEM165/GDT1 family protein [Bdellovibrionales bacterium]